MKLVTKELQERFNQLGSQEDSRDPVIIAHYFHPFSNFDWYITEYDQENEVFFGYASLFKDEMMDEWGYICKKELEEATFILPVERDLNWQECRFSEIEKKLYPHRLPEQEKELVSDKETFELRKEELQQLRKKRSVEIERNNKRSR